MKKTIPYGFIVYNSTESFIRLSPAGTIKNPVNLGFNLNKICIAQQPLDYNAALNYVKSAANENNFKFELWNSPERKPRTSLFKLFIQLFNRKK